MSWRRRQGRPFPNYEEYGREMVYCCAGACIKLLRAHKGQNAATDGVTVYREVLPRMSMWEAVLKMAICLRRLVPADLYADHPSYDVLCSDVKKCTIDQVSLRMCSDQTRRKRFTQQAADGEALVCPPFGLYDHLRTVESRGCWSLRAATKICSRSTEP